MNPLKEFSKRRSIKNPRSLVLQECRRLGITPRGRTSELFKKCVLKIVSGSSFGTGNLKYAPDYHGKRIENARADTKRRRYRKLMIKRAQEVNDEYTPDEVQSALFGIYEILNQKLGLNIRFLEDDTVSLAQDEIQSWKDEIDMKGFVSDAFANNTAYMIILILTLDNAIAMSDLAKELVINYLHRKFPPTRMMSFGMEDPLDEITRMLAGTSIKPKVSRRVKRRPGQGIKAITKEETKVETKPVPKGTRPPIGSRLSRKLIQIRSHGGIKPRYPGLIEPPYSNYEADKIMKGLRAVHREYGNKYDLEFNYKNNRMDRNEDTIRKMVKIGNSTNLVDDIINELFDREIFMDENKTDYQDVKEKIRNIMKIQEYPF